MYGWIQSALKRGKAGLPPDLTAAIEAADVFPRAGDPETGPRIYVGFRGSFIFSREETEERVRKGWPELTNEQVRRAVDFLQARVRLATTNNQFERRRKNWVLDY